MRAQVQQKWNMELADDLNSIYYCFIDCNLKYLCNISIGPMLENGPADRRNGSRSDGGISASFSANHQSKAIICRKMA